MSASRAMPISAVTVKSAKALPGHVEVTWSDGHQSAYNVRWLRHSYLLPAITVSADGREQRRVPTVPDLSSPKRVSALENGGLRIEWQKTEEISEYAPGWLLERCPCPVHRAARRRAPITWNATLQPGFPAADFEMIATSETMRLKAYRELIDYGVLLLRNTAAKPNEVENIATLFGPIAVTPYGEGGRIFDVWHDPSSRTQISANSSRYVALHMDETARYFTPGISMLHCIEAHPSGGENIVIDGFAVAEALRVSHPEAFDLLKRIPMYFSRTENTGRTFRSLGKILSVDYFGNLMGVRFNQAVEPIDAPEDIMNFAYEALGHFVREWSDPKYQVRASLRPGEVLIFDNQRVFHARTAFDPMAAKRHLQYCAIDKDMFHATFRDLSKKLGEPDWGQLLPAGPVI